MRGAFYLTTWSEGLDPANNRDAVKATSANDGTAVIVAVADGASATLFASDWAELLTQAVINAGRFGLDAAELTEQIGDASLRYQPKLNTGDDGRWQRRKWEPYGSQATLIAVRAEANGPESATVDVLAVGDSELLIARHGDVFSFPLVEPSDFGRRPPLISSLDATDFTFDHTSTTIQPGDVVVCASDGVAKALLLRASGQPQAIWSLALRLIEQPDEQRQTILEYAGSESDSGPTFDDDATLAICIYAPHGIGQTAAHAARTLLRRNLGLPEEPPSLVAHALRPLRKLARRILGFDG